MRVAFCDMAQASTRWAAHLVSRSSPQRNLRPPSTLAPPLVTQSRRCSFLLTMRRATTASARQAQQQQTLARVLVLNSCPPMSLHLDGALDLARGSAATLQTLQGLESTMLRAFCQGYHLHGASPALRAAVRLHPGVSWKLHYSQGLMNLLLYGLVSK